MVIDIIFIFVFQNKDMFIYLYINNAILVHDNIDENHYKLAYTTGLTGLHYYRCIVIIRDQK